MITKEQALTLKRGDVVKDTYHLNADDTPVFWTINGKCKTWKTRPVEWEIPMRNKYGFGYLSHAIASSFVIP